MPNPMNPIDVIAKALKDGAAEEDQNLDYWHSEARKVWAALVEHGEMRYRSAGGSYLTELKRISSMSPLDPVLVLRMPEEPNDA